MKMKMTGQFLKSRSGKNKGIIFTLDALIAVIVILLFMAFSSALISGSHEESGVQMSRMGYDLMVLINYKGLWTNPAGIESELSQYLPSSHAMILKQQCGAGGWENLAKFNSDNYNLPEQNIATGDFVFVKGAGTLTYCRARFYIWLK